MGTSKSSSKLQTCIGGALVFSGRPNPTWQVEQAVVQELEEIWGLLEPFPDTRSSAPLLGYQGCFLRGGPDLEWIAYRDVVTLKAGGDCDSRRDEDRKFEKLLLASAPEGILPASLVKNE